MAKGLARIAFENHTSTQLDRRFHPELYQGDDWFDKFYSRQQQAVEAAAAVSSRQQQADRDGGEA